MRRTVLYSALVCLAFGVNAVAQVSFSTPNLYPVGGNNPTYVAVGDFNGDGIADLAVTIDDDPTNPGSVAILLGNGDGSYQTPQLIQVDFDPRQVVVGDFNNDGILDLAVANAGHLVPTPSQTGGISILLGNGDGTFQPAVLYGTGNHPASVTFADFNGDGNLDLAVANQSRGSGQVAILLGNGDGSFQSPTLWEAGGSPAQVAAADFNGDGAVDLVVANSGERSPGGVFFLAGNGDGTFQDATNVGDYTKAESVVTDMFTGSGFMDLAVGGSRLGDAMTWIQPGNGDGTFSNISDFFVHACQQCIATGDINQDGFADVVFGMGGFPNVVYAVSNGDGSFQPQHYLRLANPVNSVAVSDLNGDSLPDIVVTMPANHSVAVLLNNGTN